MVSCRRAGCPAGGRGPPDERSDVLELIPLHGITHGGLVLRQRNPSGDRTVLIHEVLGFADRAGTYALSWDDAAGLARIVLDPGADRHPRIGSGAMTTTEQRAAPSEIAGPVVTSPQPLGIFGFPAGLLLIPARTGDEDAVRAALVSGRLPSNWPAGLDEVRRAYADPVGEGLASEVVARQHDTRNPIDRYNRWALSPDLENAATVRAGLPEPWRPLVDAVCYIVGLVHIPPADHPGCPPELRALLLTAAASAQLEKRSRMRLPTVAPGVRPGHLRQSGPCCRRPGQCGRCSARYRW